MTIAVMIRAISRAETIFLFLAEARERKTLCKAYPSARARSLFFKRLSFCGMRGLSFGACGAFHSDTEIN